MVNGTANVLGQEMTVTALVRVQEQQVAIGDNVAGSAYLSQDVEEGYQSDTLDAIKDGNTAISDNSSGGANPTAWSNWSNTNNIMTMTQRSLSATILSRESERSRFTLQEITAV